MQRHSILVLWICLSIIVFVNSVSAQGAESPDIKQVSCAGKIIKEEGRPVADATVSLLEMIYDETTFTYDPKVLGTLQTGIDGVFSFAETIEDNRSRYAHIIAEKEGLALGFDNWRLRDGDKELEIKLGPPKSLSGTVVDEQGEPIADAEVTIYLLALGEGRERPALSGAVARQQLSRKTDRAGKFAFTHIPAGATAEFIVKKAGRGTLSTYQRSNSPYEKHKYAEGQPDIKLCLPVEAKIEGVVVEKGTGKPVRGAKISCTSENQSGYFRPKPLLSKADGTFGVGALAPNQYVLEVIQSRDQLPEWVAEQLEVICAAGETKRDVKIELSKGGVLEVKVTDAVTKAPLEEASVGVRSVVGGRYQSSRADETGVVRMRLLAGDHQISQVYKQGYSRQRLQDTVTIEDGKTESLTYELAGMPKITGVVRDDKGEALEGVKVKVCPAGGIDDVMTDADGRFDMTYDTGIFSSSRTVITCLVCRHEELNLAAAAEFDEETGAIDVRLEPGVTFTGKVADPEGKGIKEATFYVNLRVANWGSPIGRDFPATDDQGRFEIKAVPPEQKYNLYVRAEGYGQLRTEVNTDNIANNRVDVGTITLALANLAVSGVVVDDEGQPVAGARLSCYGDGQPDRDTQTDTEGKFTLEQICAGKIRISASKSGATRLSGSIETEGGATDVRITVSQRSASGRYVPKLPPSLVGRPLPDLKAVGLDLAPEKCQGKRILLCFWDMEQRPSRYCVTQLAKRAQQLQEKGVVIIAVQAGQMDETSLAQWTKKYQIPFPVGMIQRSYEQARFSWGIRSLPWLILTDREHRVEANGFSLAELDERIQISL